MGKRAKQGAWAIVSRCLRDIRDELDNPTHWKVAKDEILNGKLKALFHTDNREIWSYLVPSRSEKYFVHGKTRAEIFSIGPSYSAHGVHNYSSDSVDQPLYLATLYIFKSTSEILAYYASDKFKGFNSRRRQDHKTRFREIHSSISNVKAALASQSLRISSYVNEHPRMYVEMNLKASTCADLKGLLGTLDLADETVLYEQLQKYLGQISSWFAQVELFIQASVRKEKSRTQKETESIKRVLYDALEWLFHTAGRPHGDSSDPLVAWSDKLMATLVNLSLNTKLKSENIRALRRPKKSGTF